MVHFEVQEGKGATRVHEHAPGMGVTTGGTVHMAERFAPTSVTMLGDKLVCICQGTVTCIIAMLHMNRMIVCDRRKHSVWYMVAQVAVALGKTGRHFIGRVKQSHSLHVYPEAYLEPHMKDSPAGGRMILRFTIDGIGPMGTNTSRGGCCSF